MREAFIEASIDRFEDDIDFHSITAVRFREVPEELATPSFQLIANNSRADFSGGGDTKTDGTLGTMAVIKQKPAGGPESASLFFEF